MCVFCRGGEGGVGVGFSVKGEDDSFRGFLEIDALERERER